MLGFSGRLADGSQTLVRPEAHGKLFTNVVSLAQAPEMSSDSVGSGWGGGFKSEHLKLFSHWILIQWSEEKEC